MSFIECYDENGKFVGSYNAPFDVEVDCYKVRVYGEDFSGMKLKGMCKRLSFVDEMDFNDVDLSGFMDLEIGNFIYCGERGILKILGLNCKEIRCLDEKLYEIMNKYLEEEDPLMRDFEGFKLEMAVNGFGDWL